LPSRKNFGATAQPQVLTDEENHVGIGDLLGMHRHLIRPDHVHVAPGSHDEGFDRRLDVNLAYLYLHVAAPLRESIEDDQHALIEQQTLCQFSPHLISDHEFKLRPYTRRDLTHILFDQHWNHEVWNQLAD
jgi:hypothetical protein